MKIGEFRAAVDSLNWNRRDLSGATRQEFVAMDVRTRLERHIVIVTGLLWFTGRASTAVLVTVIIGIAIVFSADAIVGAIAG